MGPLLKALGLTIWGLVALGLLAVFIFVGYQAAVKLRGPAMVVAATESPQVQTARNASVPSVSHEAPKPAAPDSKISVAASNATPLAVTRQRFGEAAEQRRFAAVLDSGRQLYDAGLATPDDLVIIAHAFSAIGDCGNARVWAGRANDALRAVGSDINAEAERLQEKCTPELPPAYAVRHAGNSPLADRFVKLGEAYYGLGEYQQAVTSLQRGLDIGGSSYLDEAYVYLGRSQLQLNHIEAACRSFRSLKEVPTLNPRVLKLWELFADMRC